MNGNPSDRSFIDAFERGDIAAAAFHHPEHLRLALAYLADSRSEAEAVRRMSAALAAFARANGHESKYHETLTIFWIRSVARLLDRQLPLEYYSRERLFGDVARRQWVDPDLKPL
ncbi:MAG TPA: hypothetical protein VFA27_10775 [Vicinamibacterales bacterium]|nr:hypothetical protein [Vicinamibacterales bacterium]